MFKIIACAEFYCRQIAAKFSLKFPLCITKLVRLIQTCFCFWSRFSEYLFNREKVQINKLTWVCNPRANGSSVLANQNAHFPNAPSKRSQYVNVTLATLLGATCPFRLKWKMTRSFRNVRKKIFIKPPFCGKNEKLSKTFIEKLNKFTNFNFIFIILWQTRRIKSLFNNKDKNIHRSKVIYKGDCSCGVDYIGETVRNLAVRTAEHSNPAHTYEPAKHLREYPSHSFTWRVLSSAQTFHKHRIVKGLMIQQFRPSLNKQVISYVSKLFPTGITLYIRYICMRADGHF